jgi:hypothetical protein
MTALGKFQTNTSGIRDAATANGGAAEYFASSGRLFEEWQKERKLVVPDLKVIMGDGVKGEKGIEGGWGRLCQGNVGADEGLVYRL